jgi:hypothetical protein
LEKSHFKIRFYNLNIYNFFKKFYEDTEHVEYLEKLDRRYNNNVFDDRYNQIKLKPLGVVRFPITVVELKQPLIVCLLV